MDCKNYLDTTVLQEKKPVTYRSLARSLNIHVNVAKQALYQYSLAQQSTVSTIYCLTGASIDNTFSIRLVNEDDLEETKKEYRQLSGVHVYSVLPCKPKDLSVLVTVHKDMVAVPLEDRVKNGLIWNNSVSTIKPGSKATTTSTTTATPAPKPPAVPATTTPSKTTFGLSSTTTKKPAASTTPAKRKGTLSFEKAAPKAKKQATEKKKSPSPLLASRKVKTIQVSEDEESEDEEALDARLARSAKIQANDFFSDDDDDGDEKMTNNTTEQKHDDSDDHSMKTASPVMESNEDIKIDDNTPLKEDQAKEDDDDDEEKEPTPGKIRRKVLKKKTYKNERGFLVTEDTLEWEEVDAETSAAPKKTPPPKPKAAPSPPAKKSAATKKAPGEQKSLLSFWGKR